ncbi:YesL family protein [Streptomyces nodosus]|uniref:YesL family protein n=1 Tax=Streptomyces nodosus TaxID=40318 RepID=UPI0034517FB7
MNTPVAGRRPGPNLDHGSWELVWSHIHRVLVVNLGLAVTNAPLLLALGVVHRPWQYPVFFVLLSFGLGPSLAAAFHYLRRTTEDDRAPVADLFRGYRRLFVPALLGWAPWVLLVAVAATDMAVLRRTAPGPALVPLLVVVALVAASSGTVTMAALGDEPRISSRTLLTACYASVRRWWLGLLNLALLGITLVLVNQAPLLGLAVLPGCTLFVVRSNSRAMLTTVAPAADLAVSHAHRDPVGAQA